MLEQLDKLEKHVSKVEDLHFLAFSIDHVFLKTVAGKYMSYISIEYIKVQCPVVIFCMFIKPEKLNLQNLA